MILLNIFCLTGNEDQPVRPEAQNLRSYTIAVFLLRFR